MIYTIDEKPGMGMILSPLKERTLLSDVCQHYLIVSTPKKNALAIQAESSNADFCLTCLCIYDTDGGCMCTKYSRNSAGDYIAKQEAK